MNGEIIKLKNLALTIQEEVKVKVNAIKQELTMVCIIIGNDPSALSYINGLKKNAVRLGINIQIEQLPTTMSEELLIAKLNNYSQNPKISGIIIQMPLPPHINKHKVADSIDYLIDLDGLHPYNQGLLCGARPHLIPATAWAIDLALVAIAREKNIDLVGARALIIGRSDTVGKPAFHLLLQRNVTPTIAHTKTKNIAKIAAESDIVVACCGVPELIDGSYVKRGSIVLDVGIHAITFEDSCKLVGDVNSESVVSAGGMVTAVPGGIGALTSALLYANCLKAFYARQQQSVYFDFEA